MKINEENLKNRIEKIMLDFVAVRTDTNSVHERNIKDFFKNWFADIPYFSENENLRGFFHIPGDHLQRVVPWALLKGSGRDTVVLIHHYDIVDTKDYRHLEHLALDPPGLMQAYKKGEIELSPQAKSDLDTGDWLFGRGVADMKGGGAVHMALFEEYTKAKDFKGNLLLISVPDEENLSAGMLGAVHLLKELKDEHNLNYGLMLDVEFHEREADGYAAYYNGSVGKVLPLVYVRGGMAHASRVFEGLNPARLLSEIIVQTELNMDFTEKIGNTVSPPPTWLYAKDAKTVYDVSLPDVACGCMNILPLSRSPKEIMDMLQKICEDSFEKLIDNMNIAYEKWQILNEDSVKKLPWRVNVKHFSDLYNQAVKEHGEVFEKALESTNTDIRTKFFKNEISMIEGANLIIKKTLEFVSDTSPIIVLALIPPFYPCVHNNMLGEKAEKADDILAKACEYTREELGENCKVKTFFTGITDLSYAMFTSEDNVIQYIEENMLLWKSVYNIPLTLIKELSMPVLNIGPWAREIHKYTERVYLPDLYYKIPRVTDFIVKGMLNEEF